jgi:hypothetical protein
MRTTLSIDEDVLDRARKAAGRLRLPFKTVVNEALRLGLEKVERPAKCRRHRTVGRDMGLRSGFNLDNVQELLAQSEGEGYR